MRENELRTLVLRDQVRRLLSCHILSDWKSRYQDEIFNGDFTKDQLLEEIGGTVNGLEQLLESNLPKAIRQELLKDSAYICLQRQEDKVFAEWYKSEKIKPIPSEELLQSNLLGGWENVNTRPAESYGIVVKDLTQATYSTAQTRLGFVFEKTYALAEAIVNYLVDSSTGTANWTFSHRNEQGTWLKCRNRHRL